MVLGSALGKRPNSWSKFPETTAAAGLVHVYMMPGPWSWMNSGAVRETDLVVDALRKKYGLTEGSPLKGGLKRISPVHPVDRMPDIPYFIVCDMKDEIFPEKGMDDYGARLKTRCCSVEYVKLPNQKHGCFTPEARKRFHDFVCKQ